MTNPTTIKWNTSKLEHEFFPLITFPQGMLDDNMYLDMKSNFPNLKDFKTTNSGQQHRTNIELRFNGSPENKHNIDILRQKYPSYYKLLQHLNTPEFKQQIFQKFTSELMTQHGFIGNIEKASVLMQICESTGGYENPFHIDSRKRIVHGLLYFGDDMITYGGELCIAKHKHMAQLNDYPQYPKLENLEDIKAFPPKDNFGLFILSTPNSYHKGNAMQGIRRFLYISIDYTGRNKVAWECGWTKSPKRFEIGLADQQQDNRRYKMIQKTISKQT